MHANASCVASSGHFMKIHFLFFSPVVGYTNDPESLQIDEGSDRTFTVGFLKPPVDAGDIGQPIVVPFLINNSQNTGSL